MNMCGIVNTVKNLFDWTPVAVSRPVELYCDYRDKGRVLLGYEVVVTYKHHGQQKYLFSDDEDRMCFVTKARARKIAFDFYKQQLAKVK